MYQGNAKTDELSTLEQDTDQAHDIYVGKTEQTV